MGFKLGWCDVLFRHCERVRFGNIQPHTHTHTKTHLVSGKYIKDKWFSKMKFKSWRKKTIPIEKEIKWRGKGNDNDNDNENDNENRI